jgi:hypothetical protein
MINNQGNDNSDNGNNRRSYDGEIFESSIASDDLFKIQDEIVTTMIRGIRTCCAFVP